MKTSELIKFLQDSFDKNGDLEIYKENGTEMYVLNELYINLEQGDKYMIYDLVNTCMCGSCWEYINITPPFFESRLK